MLGKSGPVSEGLDFIRYADIRNIGPNVLVLYNASPGTAALDTEPNPFRSEAFINYVQSADG